MDLIKFFGRFHILVLHLPIGILMIAAIMLVIDKVKLKQLEPLNPIFKSIPFLMAAGFIFAVKACALGYLLSIDGGYNPEAINAHFYAGVSLAILSGVFAYIAYYQKGLFSKISLPIAAILFGLITVTGHLGGNLTHGETYLFEYGHNFVKKAGGIEIESKKRVITSLEDAQIYPDVIAPIIKKTCISCHSGSKQKGELSMTTFEAILKGGKHGPSIVAGDLDKSELYKRITLDHGDEEFMPTDGKKPLEEGEVEVIKFWIESGTQNEVSVASLSPSAALNGIISAMLNLDGSAKESSSDVVNVNYDLNAIQNLQSVGFMVKRIAQNTDKLDVNYTSLSPLDKENLKYLLPLKGYIARLSLVDMGLANQDLEIINQLSELVYLKLNNNQLDDNGVIALYTLGKLKTLVIRNTNISKKGVGLLTSKLEVDHIYN
ncbi:MAG: c-type cytochrome domain-containing protein [Cyclobacteriaceae bacterium]